MIHRVQRATRGRRRQGGDPSPSQAQRRLVIALNVPGATALVDEDGVVVRVLPMELESVGELEALVREHLGVDL